MRRHVTAALIVLMASASCSTPQSASRVPAAESPEPAPLPAANAASDAPANPVPAIGTPQIASVGPWPGASAADGMSRLQLTGIFAVPPSSPGAHPRLHIQGRIETGDADLVLSDAPSDISPRARLVVDDDPGEIVVRSIGLDRFCLQDVSIEDIDAGANPQRIRSLVVECQLRRVRKWTTVTIALASGDGQRSVVEPPYEYVLTPEKCWVWLGAWATDRSMRGLGGDRPRYQTRGIVMRADVRDARGAILEPGGGGGGASMFQDRMHPDVPLVYPVTATVRVPAEFEVIPAVYRFTDVDLSNVGR